MATARLVGDQILLELDPQRRQTEEHLAKGAPGMRYHVRRDEHADRPHFTFPLSWASCVTLRGVFGRELAVDASLAHWARMELDLRIKPSLALRDTLEVPEELRAHKLVRRAEEVTSADGAKKLRPYQVLGAAFLATAGSAILADEMRVGKSQQSIGAGRILNALPALFVVPNSTKYQWLEYLQDWWPECSPVIIRGTLKERSAAIASVRTGEHDVAIINWEALRGHSRHESFGSAVSLKKCVEHGGEDTERQCEVHPRELNDIKFKAVVADEAHRAVHPRTQQTRALWAVAWEADYRWALTGTPVLDTPVDIWALMHFVAPEEAPQKTYWIDRYCLTGFNGFADEIVGLRPDTREELFSYVDPRFLRRTRDMVMPWLPEKIPTRRDVEMTPKQTKAYQQMEEEMLAELENGDITYVTSALAKLTRLRQFASAYAYVDAEGNLIMQTPSCKAEAILEIAEELGGRPAVVWAESRQLIEITGKALAKEGYGVGYITGTVSDSDRAQAITEFQRGDLQFMCATIGAAGEGITLDRADVAVFLQRSFSMVKNQQAEDRIVGQDSGPGLEVIDVVTRDTIEERVFSVLGNKERISEEIVRDRDTFRRLLGMP